MLGIVALVVVGGLSVKGSRGNTIGYPQPIYGKLDDFCGCTSLIFSEGRLQKNLCQPDSSFRFSIQGYERRESLSLTNAKAAAIPVAFHMLQAPLLLPLSRLNCCADRNWWFEEECAPMRKRLVAYSFHRDSLPLQTRGVLFCRLEAACSSNPGRMPSFCTC